MQRTDQKEALLDVCFNAYKRTLRTAGLEPAETPRHKLGEDNHFSTRAFSFAAIAMAKAVLVALPVGLMRMARCVVVVPVAAS